MTCYTRTVTRRAAIFCLVTKLRRRFAAALVSEPRRRFAAALVSEPRRRFAAALVSEPRRRFAAALVSEPRRRFAAALVMAIGLSSAAAPAHGAVVIALDLAQLVDQSDFVVVAQPEGESSRFSKGLIVSDVTLRVSRVLKGATAPGATLIVTRLGGSVGQLALNVPGAARFPPNQSAIVFLRRAEGRSELQVTGMSQGVMPITGQGPSAQVAPGGAGATLMQRDEAGALKDVLPPAAQSRTMDDVIGEIQKLIAGAD